MGRAEKHHKAMDDELQYKVWDPRGLLHQKDYDQDAINFSTL